ncbi:uncharacterized protein B0T23DRAFT_201777 [Neurospora hispaniola]|uniref:Uncharacterized protein n=1 Tax=Neurospora hispaniola TaxID=588809 RepID=A0AAJ0I4J0_9PEZI|nr:hypothetical protein B0T23DRAFT_201777 [Neurospora hispaniola]
MVLERLLPYKSTVCLDMTDRSSDTYSPSPHGGNAGCWGGLRTARSTWPVASRIQTEGRKGHGLARGSNARQQGSGIWFAVEGGKPWRSATCISARPEQEVVVAVLSPNIEKGVGDRRVIVNVRVRHAGGHGHRFMAQKNSESPLGANPMNRSSSLRHHHLIEATTLTPPSAGLLVIRLTNAHGILNLLRTVCLEVTHCDNLHPFPSL